MTKLPRFSAAVATALLLAACGSSDEPADSGASEPTADPELVELLPDKIKEAGVLRVVTDATYPPFEYFDTDNTTIIGSDADLADALAGRFGLELELINTSFDGIIPTLDADKADLALAGMADQEERRETVTFVDYGRNAPAFLMKPETTTVATFADLCGETVAVQSATSMADNLVTQSQACEDAGEPPLDIDEYKGQDQVVLAVQSGRAIVAVTTGGSGAYLASEADGQFSIVIPPDDLSEEVPLGIGVPSRNTELVEAVHAALSKLIDDGTYDEIMSKWGLTECCSYTEKTINNAAP